MILELLKKLQTIFKPSPVENAKPKALDPLGVLQMGYYDLCRLAEQINSHAERAPYPHVAQRLRQIAAEKRKNANALREKITSLGGRLEEPELDLKSGKNHWERMVRDLEDQKALEAGLLEHAVRLVEAAPDIGEFLRGIVAAQMPHKETLLDLVTRADPQAEQS